MIITPKTYHSQQIGGKARALAELSDGRFLIPAWFVITPDHDLDDPAILSAAEALGADAFAVRSSGMQEDGADHSFAGQFATKLYVHRADLRRAIAEVRESNQSAHLQTYQQSQGLTESAEACVIVQAMLHPEASGVAFSKSPLPGAQGECFINALWGVGSALVSGEADADSWSVREGAVVDVKIVRKEHAHRPDSSAPEGVSLTNVPVERQSQPSLTEAQVREVAALAQACEDWFGSPQDIEWAIQEGRLYLLQSRPITTLKGEDGELTVWDNSNIAESYSGITSPLTFTFAQRAYENVYREFCRILSVPPTRIADHDHVFGEMLGHIQGHVYYNLNSWYHVLALLPGFQVNRGFMEQMMGVKEPMPEEVVAEIVEKTSGSKVADTLALGRTLVGLIRAHHDLPVTIATFYARLNRALERPTSDLAEMSPAQLVTYHHELEQQLLRKWDAPLINDFLAMIFYGVLGKLCDKWLAQPSLHNALLLDCGDIISAEPPRLMRAMAETIRANPTLQSALIAATDATAREDLIVADPVLEPQYTHYLERFGDRCMEELKLESQTVTESPAILIDSILTLSQRAVTNAPEPPKVDLNDELKALPAYKKRLFHWVLRHAREKVRNRENLRFERTRLFGRVRQIMLALGDHYTAAGALRQRSDVFLLTLQEALDYQHTLAHPEKTSALVSDRQRVQETYLTPPDRFTTRGDIRPDQIIPSEAAPVDALDLLTGMGACPGVVKGRVKVFTSPRDGTLEPGEILVAQQTDPGWVVLFPAAAAILVERGSLLSHSAIVARELGIPCIVSIPKVTSQLKSGDLVQINGTTGEVNVLERSSDKPS